jgi:puromycin-sensitive aminopeptidase
MVQHAANPYRLSDDVLPQAYRLRLAPDLEAATFSGTVEIDLDIVNDVDAIVLNALDLEISDAVYRDHSGNERSCTVTLDVETERASFTSDGPFAHGLGTLSMSFTGILNDLLVGFYRSTFVDPDGLTRTIATTQMEATDARRAFPCFDEPAKKATFTITLVVPEDLAAYSNSPVAAEERPGDGTKVVSFAPTMVMSTYLVAFIVGPFEETDPIDVDGVPVRIVYPPGKGNLAPFALDVAAHSLRYFTEYFNIPYPGDKLDLVAIPDFAFGAMENLGCVTFRETALLVDPATASRLEVERVVDVIAHEIAHMWFGDLVTMGWWEGIWLNEAFATFMEIKCTDAFRPQWHRWVSFGIEREVAMATDGLHTTRPIEFEVISPADARGMFDVLTYQKGGSVLRMLEQFLGEDTFRDGIRHYLQVHAYGNTVTRDLWDALESVSTHPVRTIMDTWILQGGHPVLTVEDGTVTQTSFAYGLPDGETAIGDIWLVPMMTRPLGDATVTTQVLGREPIPVAPATIVNAGGWGVYRTSYGSNELREIAANLGQLTALERATLVADTWAATLAGHRTLADFLTLAKGLGTEIEPATWTVVAGALGTTNRIVSEAERPLLAEITRSLFGDLFDLLGWEATRGEDEQAPTLRSLVLSMLGTIGQHVEIRAEAHRRFDAGEVAGDVADAIIAIVGDDAETNDFDEAFARFKAATDPQSEHRYLAGLAGFASDELVARMFDLCLSDEVRSQDGPYMIASLLANRVGGEVAFDLLCANWESALARFPKDSHSRMLSGVARMISSKALATKVSNFLDAHPIHSGQRTVSQAIERMWVGQVFAERERPELGLTLQEFLAS